jgi:hypothetical protein
MKRCCLLAILALSGCANEELPSNPLPYLSETRLVDFNFSQPIDYMEHRLIYFMGAQTNPNDYTIVTEFSPAIKSGLTETQLLFLSQAVSLGGLGSGCMPASCSFYFVIVYGESVLIIDNELDLMELIGDVDSPAELHLVLFSGQHYPLFYEVVEDGYRVLASWSNCSGGSGQDLLAVDRLGNITLIKHINKKQENTMC